MRKIPSNLENPIDDVAISLCEKSERFYRRHKFTPNQLTFLSFFFGLVSAVFFYYDYRVIAVLFFMLTYYFDCMDGFYARKYNMETKLGEILDHTSDFIRHALILYIIYLKKPKRFFKIIPIILIFNVFLMIHIGCQEQYFNSDVEQPFLDNFKKMCPDKSNIKYTRFLGCGTFQIIFYLIMLFY